MAGTRQKPCKLYSQIPSHGYDHQPLGIPGQMDDPRYIPIVDGPGFGNIGPQGGYLTFKEFLKNVYRYLYKRADISLH
jgi:hypothetical protein